MWDHAEDMIKEIKAITGDVENKQYKALGSDIAELLVLALGPVPELKEVHPEDLVYTAWMWEQYDKFLLLNKKWSV